MTQILSLLGGLFKKENLKLLLFAAIAVFMIIFFQTCNQNSKLKEQIEIEKAEQRRILNNWDASRDTLRQFKDENGTLKGEIQGYALTQKELVNNYADLFSSVEKFKKEWQKTPPVTIVETKYVITEKIKDFQVSVNQNGKTGLVNFSSDTTFNQGNYRKISGKLPYSLSYFNKADSSYVDFSSSSMYAKVNPFSPEVFLEQRMNLNTGINKDKETGKLKIWVTTDYPGVSFSEIRGAEIKEEGETAKLFQKPRKTWGVGFSVGPGILYDPSNRNFVPGIYMGVGINFTPKKLQF